MAALSLVGEDLLDRLNRLKKKADLGPIGKKKSSFEMYALLAECMSLALQCKRDPQDGRALRDLLNEGRKGSGRGPGSSRRGVLSTSSEFLIVCRFVFNHGTSDKAQLSNASRYGKALEEAHRLGIDAHQLEKHLKEKGGINALFLQRPTKPVAVTTKTLYLRKAVTIPKGADFVLVLRRGSDNVFEVVSDPEPVLKKT